MRVVEHRTRLPREVVDAPSLGTFQVRLDKALSSLLKLKMSLLTQSIPWFYDLLTEILNKTVAFTRFRGTGGKGGKEDLWIRGSDRQPSHEHPWHAQALKRAVILVLLPGVSPLIPRRDLHGSLAYAAQARCRRPGQLLCRGEGVNA